MESFGFILYSLLILYFSQYHILCLLNCLISRTPNLKSFNLNRIYFLTSQEILIHVTAKYDPDFTVLKLKAQSQVASPQGYHQWHYLRPCQMVTVTTPWKLQTGQIISSILFFFSLKKLKNNVKKALWNIFLYWVPISSHLTLRHTPASSTRNKSRKKCLSRAQHCKEAYPGQWARWTEQRKPLQGKSKFVPDKAYWQPAVAPKNQDIASKNEIQKEAHIGWFLPSGLSRLMFSHF